MDRNQRQESASDACHINLNQGIVNKLVVHGGQALSGSVRTAGSKNATLPIIAASLLIDSPLVINNAPNITDVDVMLSVVRGLGSSVARDDCGRVSLQSHPTSSKVCLKHMSDIRGSIAVLGPILSRRGHAKIHFPGGCNFGNRPVDVHLDGLRELGAEIVITNDTIVATAPKCGLHLSLIHI